VEMEGVESSWISEFGYDEEAATVYVTFRDNGMRWQYRNVPEHVWYEFRAASSKGTFIREVLNDFDNGPA
jgi:KTSC domain